MPVWQHITTAFCTGRWIDAEQDAWEIYDEVQDMLKASPIAEAEEWAIHDYEGFEGVRISEWESFEDVSKMAAFIAEHGALGGQLLAHFDSLEDAEKAISEGYAGTYESLADFARRHHRGNKRLNSRKRGLLHRLSGDGA